MSLGSNKKLSPELFGVTLEEMVAMGEVLELKDSLNDLDGLALQYPGFVKISKNNTLLLGSEDYWMHRARNFGFTINRSGIERITASDGILDAVELDVQVWLSAPMIESAEELVSQHIEQLMQEPDARFSVDVEILSRDNNLPRRYYKARKRKIKPSDNGLFVADRGLGLWAFVLVDSGKVVKVKNFENDAYSSALAEARHLMYALDSVEGFKNEFVSRTTQTSGGLIRQIGIFSPPVPWVDRYLNACSVKHEELGAIRGTLKTYNLHADNVEKCKELFEKYMFISEGVL